MHDGSPAANRYFYLHDRLGSVRQVIDKNAVVKKYCSYDPFGKTLEGSPPPLCAAYPFMFTGQYYDWEIGQYYLRARQYDPILMRFTIYDPVTGKYRRPLTLHKYLYCLNDPINRIDPTGQESLAEAVVVQGIIGSLFGAMEDGWSGFVTGGLTGAAGGAFGVWFSGAGLFAKVATNSIISGGQMATYDLAVKGKVEVEKILCSMISGGIFESAAIGFGQTAGKDFTKMLIKDYGLKWGQRYSYILGEVIRESGWESLNWLYSSYFEPDEDY